MLSIDYFQEVKALMEAPERNEMTIHKRSLVEKSAGMLDFLLLMSEKLLVLAGIMVLAWWACKLFVAVDAESIHKAKAFVKICHENWIGALVFAPLLFYRVAILKLIELEQLWSAKFRQRAPNREMFLQGIEFKEG